MNQPKLIPNDKCLNCGSTIGGRYCSNCGQEHVNPKQSFGHLVWHFFSDIFHFDGKFLTTCRYLFTRPGFLSKEYINGKRASYFHPIRMYLFTSAIFFLLFFNLFSPRYSDVRITGFSKQDSLFYVNGALPVTYQSAQEYDSMQATLPKKMQDHWFYRKMAHRSIELGSRYQADGFNLFKDLFNKFFHSLPYLLFLSLPLYASYLKLLYRRQKVFYYSDHAVFLLHLYIFSFLLLMIGMLGYKLIEFIHFNAGGVLFSVLALYAGSYAYLAMLNFYAQSKTKTLLKFVLLNISVSATFLVLLGILFIISLFQV